MSLIKQLMAIADGDELLEGMIVEMVDKAIALDESTSKLGLSEAMGSRGEPSGMSGPKQRDIVIKVDGSGMKPFVVVKTQDGTVFARNPKDGETIKLNAQHLTSGIKAQVKPIRNAAERLESKYQGSKVYVADDQRGQARGKETPGGQFNRKAPGVERENPEYDDSGAIVFKPQPEFRGAGGINQNSGQSGR